MKKSKPNGGRHTSKPRLGQLSTFIRAHQTHLAVLTLLTLGVVSRFYLFGYPNQTVFDEVYFGKFVSSYFSGNYFFDIHPPFAKLLIAGFARLMGYNPTLSFAAIGTVFTDNGYLYLRFLPSLAGALLPLTLFAIARELGMKTRTAFFVGMLALLDNALLVQSRFVLIDSLLLAFGFGSFWLYLVGRRQRKVWIYFAAAVLASCAVSIKWIALPFVFLPLLFEFLHHASLKRMLKIFALFTSVAIVLYLSFFAIHVALLDKAGDGDVFMSQAFQHTLEGNQYTTDSNQPPMNLPAKIVEVNREMYAANARLTATHPYGSKWYGWPVMIKPISYWVQDKAQIWLVGNPLVWWGGVVAIIWLVGDLLGRAVKPKRLPVALFLALAYFAAWLPFALISRVMFLYHYLIPLGFSILIIGFVCDRLTWKTQLLLIVVAAVGFGLFAATTYGLALNEIFSTARNIIPGWQ